MKSSFLVLLENLKIQPLVTNPAHLIYTEKQNHDKSCEK